MPAGPLPPLLHTTEPPQAGPKQTQVESPSQPVLVIGYKRPDEFAKDDPVFDVISSLLAGGRTGVLYKEMVRDRRISLVAAAEDTMPGGKYPNLFIFFLAPALGHTVDENEKALYEILDRFQSTRVDADSLERVKTKTRAGLIRRLASNAGLASLLTAYYADYGDWRKLFTSIDEINRVTAEDVQRVARQYFTASNRTVAFTVQSKGQAGGGK
jgi:predicted Zn-dependent peptidase